MPPSWGLESHHTRHLTYRCVPPTSREGRCRAGLKEAEAKRKGVLKWQLFQ